MDAVKFHTSHSAELSPTGPKLWEIILRSWQVELSKSETSHFRSDLVFYRKLCACNLLTWGLNVVLRYLKSSDFCVAEILWASNVPESSRCWQHHSNYQITTRLFHILQDMPCDLFVWVFQKLSTVSVEIHNHFITFKWDQILSWIYEVISYNMS